MSTPNQVLELARKAGARMVDLKFVDTFGGMQHFGVPTGELTAEAFGHGFEVHGSSIRGWKSVEVGDLLAIPDPATAFIDPFCAVPTLSLTCTLAATGTRQAHARDPRGIAQRAEQHLAGSGLADGAVFGPEAGFFLFDDVRYESRNNGCFYSVDSEEAVWNTGRDEMPNLGCKIRHGEGRFPVAPVDTQQDLRTEMVLVMEQLGIRVERQHHGGATAGQGEIGFRGDTLVKTADTMMLSKYVIRNVARKHGKTATFMPKPLFGDHGSGMPTHMSLWKKGKPLFSGSEYAGLSTVALHYIGGLLQHARALAAICNPTVNSYRRLVPGSEAPLSLGYSARHRSAAIRIPTSSDNPKARRVEYRPPDSAANPYLCFAALLMAGLDGVRNRIDPGKPLDRERSDPPAEERTASPRMPGSLDEALGHLQEDHGFLLEGDVFGRDFLETWVEQKRKESDAVRLRPHPHEFLLYYDC